MDLTPHPTDVHPAPGPPIRPGNNLNADSNSNIKSDSRSRSKSRSRTNSTTLSSAGVFRFEQDDHGISGSTMTTTTTTTTTGWILGVDVAGVGLRTRTRAAGDEDEDEDEDDEDEDEDEDGPRRSFPQIQAEPRQSQVLPKVQSSYPSGSGSGSGSGSMSTAADMIAGSLSSNAGWDVPSLVGSPEDDRRRQGRTGSIRERGWSVDSMLGTPETPGWDDDRGAGWGAVGDAVTFAVEGSSKGKGRAEDPHVVRTNDEGMSSGWQEDIPFMDELDNVTMAGLQIRPTTAPVILGPTSRGSTTPDLPSRTATPTPASFRPLATAAPSGPSSSKKDLPQWLKNRPRSSSSASLASKFSLSSTASMSSLSSRLTNVRTKIKSKVGKGTSGPLVETSSGPTDVAGLKEPKGLIRRLMIRSKTTPVFPRTAPTVINESMTKLDDAHASGTIVSPRRSSMGLSDVFASSSSPDRRVSASSPPRDEAETDKIEPIAAQTLSDDTLEIVVSRQPSEAPISKASPFQDKLPRELQLMVVQALVELHVTDHERIVRQGRWKGDVARQRWYGETAGRRELLKMRRVCTGWNDLILDGQLWSKCHMALYLDFMPPSTLIKVLRSSSSCIRTLDTAGWRDLPGDLLIGAMQARGTVDTGLEKLDLQGCREIGPHELWWLIRHSPRLKWLSLRGLNRVYPEHIHALASCPLLEYLDLAFCKNLPIKCVALLTSMDRPSMRELRISGFEGSKELSSIATRMPNLQTLDMAYCPDLTDEDLKHLVSPSFEEWVPELAKMNAARCRRDSVLRDVRIAFLTSGQAGQAAAEFTGCKGLVPRRILKLRKLVLSQCPRLTDQSCQYLAHAVPALEIFEMASADGNSNLQTAGLVDLFKTCPAIRKIDLEGALDIDDDLLSALTPRPSEISSNAVGSRLETVCLGFAGNVTAGAMLDMIRQCSCLKHLDIDNTTASDLLVKEFVRKRGRSTVLSVVDCRGVSRNVVEALESRTRPRNGWRGWQAAPLRYQDGSRLNGGPDECSDAPVIQSFWTWNRVPRADRPISMSLDRDRFRASLYDTEHLPDTENSCIIM